MGLHVFLHRRDVAAALTLAFVEGSQPLASTPVWLGVLKVLSLVVFGLGMNALEAAYLDS